MVVSRYGHERFTGDSSPHWAIIFKKDHTRYRDFAGASGEVQTVVFEKPSGLKDRLREAGDAYRETNSHADSATLNTFVTEAVEKGWSVGEITRAARISRGQAQKRVDKIRKAQDA